MNNVDIINISLEYYDKISEEYDNILKDIDNVDFKIANNDLEYNKIYFYQNNKLLLETKYEIMGAYYPKNKIWIWGWGLHKLNKKYIKIIKNLFDYGIQLDPDIPNNYYLKMELLTSRFKISDNMQLEIYTAIASYLSKIPYVFKYDSSKYNNEKSNEQIIYYLFIIP